MGLLKRLLGIQQESTQANNAVDRHAIPAAEIDRMQRIEASESYRNRIYKRFYSDYPEMPFISQDRELNTNWMDQVAMAPTTSLVSKRMMTRYSDGLLPGHVYMLYWLNKYSLKRRIPSYFEYDYGIDFCRELLLLRKQEFIGDDDKPTSKGLDALEQHREVISERHPAPKNSGAPNTPTPQQTVISRTIPQKKTASKSKVPDKDFDLIKAEVRYLNTVLDFACGLANISGHLHLDSEKFVYRTPTKTTPGLTYYEWVPFTPSGKPSKYPLVLHYTYNIPVTLASQRDRFGKIYFMQNGAIGKATLIFWTPQGGRFFEFGQTKNKLVVKKVEKSSSGNRVVLYKEK